MKTLKAALQARIKQLWELRHSRQPVVRIGWWIGVVLLLCLLLKFSVTATLLIAILIIGNLCYSLTCFAWMVFHPRGMVRATEEALRWSTWLAALATLLIYLAIEPDLSKTVSSGIILIIALASAPFCFMLLLLFSMFGVSIGAYTYRKSGDTDAAGTAAVLAWWSSVTVCVLGVILLDWLKVAESLQVTLIVCLPLLTCWITHALRRFHYGEPRRARKWVDSLLKRLVFRRLREGRYHTLDLRGVAIGLFVAVCMLLLGNRMLLTASESALVSLFRMRAQLVNNLDFHATPVGKVVLAELDAHAQALTTSSEAAVQADIIRHLNKMHPNCIVLPLPTLDVKEATRGETTQEAVAHTIRDLPDLAKAMRESGRVLLVVTPEQRQMPVVKPLLDAAYAVGQFGEHNYPATQVPAIPLHWGTEPPPIPLLVLAKTHEVPLTVQPIRGDRGAMNVSGVPVPEGLPGEALIDFRSGAALKLAREGVASFPYSVLMSSMSSNQLMLNDQFSGHPVDTSKYLHGKVIFLEPLVQPELETPVGVLPQYEVLARATNSLLTDSVIGRVSPVLSALWTLLVGMGIGWVCAGRDPLKASWRVALVLMVQLAYVLLVYLLAALWADPVTPLVTALITFLLVTQLTFALGRDEQERNRALFSRFLAKEFVDELLQAPTVHLALGGEKRNVCVLFADVRNFTGFAETHPPEEVIEIMNLYLTGLTDALDLYGGLLDKYTGDGLMAFFEIKHDPPAELERAVCASLAMRDAALVVSERLRTQGRRTLEIGIGMHYGEAIVGLMGNEQRQINYTALGHTVVVSARLQTLAAGGEVVISETVHAAVQEKFCFHAIDPVHVKGISIEMRPFHVLGPIENSTDLI